MDPDDQHLRGTQHRPPVLLQSDDHDHSGHHSRRSSNPHPLSFGLPDKPLSRQGHRHDDMNNDYDDSLFGYHSDHGDHRRGSGSALDEDERPAPVHAQACQDSCPVQDIYTETCYSRFSKGARTNLYGLAVIKELESSTPPAPRILDQGISSAEDTSTNNDRVKGSSIFTSSGDIAYKHLPARYALVAAGGTIKCFMGLQESFEFTLGEAVKPVGSIADTGATGATESPSSSAAAAAAASTTATVVNQEIISMDAFERKDGRGCQLVIAVSIAKGENPAQFELRFYGANTFGESIRDLLVQLPNTTDIQSIPIPWAPTKIAHTPLDDDPFEMAVLVAGSDSSVHFFVQDLSTSDTLTDKFFDERPIEPHVTVLASFTYCEYCVLSLDVKDYPTCRVVAAGTQNGTLNVGIIPRDPKTLKLTRSQTRCHTVVLFAPITTLSVFTSRVPTEHRQKRGGVVGNKDGQGQTQADQQAEQSAQTATNEQQKKEDMKPHDVEVDEAFEEEEETGIHLLVTCAIEQAWVYR
ncbi:hypothetical protein BC939DRAFT_5297 [Gamsiella multidivaricata]|uniref:uncharacterized protein n=1 Tax=Gamsiella multidivaricata TaxID=101098 RepID=UPI00221FA6A6|nr:uncharacterized protein BC939DRAFT_5297 [Gamsiella multidivaricata]KAI7832754.1 hypothetical protein BC939DRAFT_5297 [Gamsiella multidivaricata]